MGVSKVTTLALLFAGVEGFNGPGRPIISEPTGTGTGVVTEAPGGALPVEVPEVTTEEPAVDPSEWMKAVVHDFQEKEDCWNGLAESSSDCWTGSDGVSYRYGCSNDEEGKVYTDICETDTCDPDSCLGEWTWHEEYSKTCYNDGSAFYQFECTKLDLEDDYSASSGAGKIEGASSLTCQQLGWTDTLMTGESPFVCASSQIEGECHDDKTYKQADQACKSVGARLCTAKELEAGEAKGTGCKGDCKATWASDSCEDGGYISMAGAPKCLKDFPKTCVTTKADTASVRCCADSVNTFVGPSSGLPAGYTLATATDFSAEDKVCGGNPEASYSCWTNPVTGQTQRFACTEDSEYVWSQTCTSETCDGESCTGAWFNQKEKLGLCYSDPSGGLYSYEC